MSDHILVTENLTKKFGGLVAVDNVSLYCKKGEILGLIGANGAGKTTLFNMMSCEFQPTSGTVLFNGKKMNGLKSHDACRAGIGRTFQIVKSFGAMTVLENVMVGSLLKYSSTQKAKEHALKVLQRVGLYHRRDVLGDDLNLPEKKRMELARALATEPDLLLLDEVMAGLNPTECQEVMDLIKEIRKDGVSIILIEHVMRAIMNLSDRIYVLNQGKLLAEGTPQEVANNPAVISSYLGEE